MKILPVGAKVFHADRQTEEWTERRTDRHGEANSLFFTILQTRLKTGNTWCHIICVNMGIFYFRLN